MELPSVGVKIVSSQVTHRAILEPTRLAQFAPRQGPESGIRVHQIVVGGFNVIVHQSERLMWTVLHINGDFNPIELLLDFKNESLGIFFLFMKKLLECPHLPLV